MVSKRICVVLVVDDLGYGGAERQVVELANNMDREHFDVHVCALSNHVPLSDRLVNAQERLHIIEKAHRFDFTVVPRLARLLRTLDTDIVHGYLFSAEIASRLAGRLAGTKVIIGSERNANRKIKMSNRWVYRITQRCTDVMIANSNAGAESNREIFGLSASHYRVVHNGVDTDRFKPMDGRPIREELGVPARCPVIGAFANFKQQKNHGMLYRAFKLVLDSFPETRLLLIGDAPVDSRGQLEGYQAQLDRLVDDLGIRDRCIFLGHRDSTESLYPACDFTALSSFHEGTPNVLLESMACGVPVVATHVCDNEEIIREGRVGCLVDVGDDVTMAQRMVSMLSDAARRRQMGQNARRWVIQEFSVERLAQKMESVYCELLNMKCGQSHVTDMPLVCGDMKQTDSD